MTPPAANARSKSTTHPNMKNVNTAVQVRGELPPHFAAQDHAAANRDEQIIAAATATATGDKGVAESMLSRRAVMGRAERERRMKGLTELCGIPENRRPVLV
jgi:hypothetical protein